MNVFISLAESNAHYGFTMEPGLFGRAVMFPDDNFGNFNECKEFVATGCGPFTETDVVVNAAFATGWTGDWFAPGNDQRGGPAMVQATVLHEVGHTLGLHHVFELRVPGRQQLLDDELPERRRGTLGDADRLEDRADRVPLAGRSLLDLAIYPFVYGNEQYAQEYATLSKSSVLRERRSRSTTGLVQNVGNQAASTSSSPSTWSRAAGGSTRSPATSGLGNVDSELVRRRRRAGLNGTPLRPGRHGRGRLLGRRHRDRNGTEDRRRRRASRRTTGSSWGTTPRTVLRVLPRKRRDGPSQRTSRSRPSARSPASPSASSTPRAGPRRATRGASATPRRAARTPRPRRTRPTPTRTPAPTPSRSAVSAAARRARRSAARHGRRQPDRRRTATQTLFVPIVLDVAGQGGARFSSELTLANRGTTTATVRLTYTAASSPRRWRRERDRHRDPRAGRQLVVPDAIAYLRGKGLAIPAGGSSQGGTLRVRFEGLSSEDAGYAGVRTTTPSGRAGRASPTPA